MLGASAKWNVRNCLSNALQVRILLACADPEVTNAPEDFLPAGAQFVDAFTTGKAFLLPRKEKHAGHLVLFSRAHRTVFDTARVEKLP